MPTPRFDTYYRYADLTAVLQGWAAQYPLLCRLEELGRSYEGRPIWVLTVTNFATGPDTEKPAYWVDGNIHATELSASAAALYLLHKLLDGYGLDARITHLLDTRAFYIAPRLNPDGAEWALADRPRFIRSSTRPYPREEQLDGLIGRDVDGDGRILQMRLRDPRGNWKPHPEEPRLLIPREPDDLTGDFYRLLSEGVVQNYDGALIKMAPSRQGLDLNRNFPALWSPAEAGAGDYPGSEPEARAAISFVAAHPNITGSVSLHTFSGVHLRPPTKGPDSELPTQDLRTYKRIGRKGEELTGYPAVSVFHDFQYNPKEFIKGTFDDWMYEHRGVYAWTTEIWSPQRQAGLSGYHYIDWFREHPPAHDLQILRWFEQHIQAPSYIDWYPFEHPQFGPVELGGWHTLHTWSNPPLERLEREIAPLADFCIFNALISPKLELHSLTVQSSGDHHHIRLVVENSGWLPTNITEQALAMRAVQPLEVVLELPAQARLVTGELRQTAGQLKGRDHKGAFAIWSADETDNRARFDWVVQAPPGVSVSLVARHDRAGVLRRAFTLPTPPDARHNDA